MPPAGSKVYVGGLRSDITQREVEDEFQRFGRIFKVWIARNPAGFAFIEYEDSRDAEDAVRKLDGVNGWKVEISRSRGPGGGGGGGGGPPGGGGRGRGDMACFVCGELGHLARDCRGGPPRGGPPRRGYSPAGRRSSRSRSPPRRGYDSPPRRIRSRSPPPRGRSRGSPPRGRSPPPRSRSPPARGRSPPPRSRSPPARGRSRSRS